MKIVFSPSAQNDLEKISTVIRARLFDKLEWFENNFDSITPLFLTGQWKGFCKLRMGDWRVLYQIDWSRNYLMVHVIGHRKDIYK